MPGPNGSANSSARLGLLKPVPIEFDEVAKPHYPPVKKWREVAVMTIAYGHGISVTPLHVVTAVSAIVNGGILHPPTLRKVPAGATSPGERVICSRKPPSNMRKLMRLVVQYGTAKLAAAPGYVVGGKTGTAEKNVGRALSVEKKLLSYFVGVFPMHDPKYAILITGRRAARHEEKLRLCDGRVDRGAGDQPHHPAHRADSRRAAGRRGIAGGGSGVDGREPAGKAD